MQLFLKQFPIVVQSLNIGFLQTLKLFFVTLLGAIPLGLVIALGSMSRVKPLSALTRVMVWIVRGSPLMIQLLIIFYFPGIVLGNPIWGGGESGALRGSLHRVHHQLRLLFFRNLPRRHTVRARWARRRPGWCWV